MTATKRRRRPGWSLIRAFLWTSAVAALAGAIVLAGLGLVAKLEGDEAATTWAVWGSIGESFGVLNTIFSGFACAALVVTFWMQFHELKGQRVELASQRESLSLTQAELHRSTEANLRRLHVDLQKIALDDPDLAEVWPIYGTDAPLKRRRQYIYANLILQHIRLQWSISVYSDDEVRGALRYVFRSPLMRDFWKTTARARNSVLVPGGSEFMFARLAGEICDEYEAVLEQANLWRSGSSNDQPANEWEQLKPETLTDVA
ncbi:DUF6082 family protein [Phytohabitans houttuyneae]|uniref:Uncharacterized protein n=1 Tax=Phytohabitans houttuyneae TaxID=1076126 RepID=A0A6V8KPQ7_9ACTN|nr:DUF6082 family protein [Phytohabitans houttuyneae]GFJ85834.1 hypothetical protein Phou_100140 [Phytohabitans houttuyneae]